MTAIGVRIRNVVVGDTFGLRRTVTDLPEDTTCTQAWLTVKSASSDADALAIFQKVITTTNVNGVGQIEDDGETSGEAVLRFDCTSADTVLFTPAVSYPHDIQMLLSDGSIYTVETGTWKCQTQITLSSS